MTDTIKNLELKRNDLHEKLASLGDLRRGTISVNYRKCGKKNCACAKPGHPGHGPQYLWNTTIKRKSYAKNLKIGPELQKVLSETNNYRIFLNLCEQLVQANESLQREIGYFEKNKKRMRYKTFKNQGFFIGSGVIEAGYRAVIGQRLKQSGMHWSIKNANKIIALRCYILSNYWEDFWGSRACA